MHFGKLTIRRVLLCLVFAITGRSVWYLSQSAVGPSSQISQWINVACHLVGTERRALHNQSPVRQAAYWLPEVRRILAETQDPDVAEGAAWMLDQPQPGFLRRHWKSGPSTDFAEVSGVGLTYRFDDVARLVEEFEQQARPACLKAIETAVRLDSQNVDRRRARALLLFESGLLSLDLTPRVSNWRAILSDCATADPENALYDYLAAAYLWSASAQMVWMQEDDSGDLLIQNQSEFDEGTARFESGLTKSKLQFGAHAQAATLKFLGRTTLPRVQHLEAAASRRIQVRASRVLSDLIRYQGRRIGRYRREGRIDEAIAAAQDQLLVIDQISRQGNTFDVAATEHQWRPTCLRTLQRLLIDYPEYATAEQLQDVETALEEAERERELLELASRRIKQETAARIVDPNASVGNSSDTTSIRMMLLPAVLLTMAQQVVIVTSAFLLCALAASRILRRRASVDVAVVGKPALTCAWISGLAVSFLLFGLCPAAVPSPVVQHAIFCSGAWLSFGLLMLGSLRYVGRRFCLRRSETAAFAVGCTLIFGALLLLLVLLADPGTVVSFVANASGAAFFLWPIVGLAGIGWVSVTAKRFSQRRRTSGQRRLLPAASIGLIALVGIPSALLMYHNLHDSDLQIHIPAVAGREAEVLGIDANRLRQALTLEEQSLLWACFQWITYRAAWVLPAAAVAVLLLKIWRTERRCRPTAPERRVSTFRMILVQSFVGILRSAPVVLLISFSIYLAALPTIQRSIDTRDVIYRHRLLVPESVWAEFEAHVEVVAGQTHGATASDDHDTR